MGDQVVVRLITEAQRIQEGALYFSKSHLEESRRLRWVHLAVGIPAAVTAGLAGVSAISNQPIVAGLLATVSAVASALLTFLNPKENAAAHHAASTAFKDLFNRVRIFHEIDAISQDAEILTKSLKELDKERGALMKSAPGFSRTSFNKARLSIDAGEASYTVDREQQTRTTGHSA
jgi:hypothetical protein